MGLKEQKERYPSLRQATLMFLFEDDQILLAMKKRGFGQGRWNGVGGKPEKGERIEDAAIRETKEEIGVEVEGVSEVGKLSFYFRKSPEWNQEVIVYRTNNWKGEPRESEEMSPCWFSVNEIPYDQMWLDDRHWLPIVLRGGKVVAAFLFGENDVVEDMEVREIHV